MKRNFIICFSIVCAFIFSIATIHKAQAQLTVTQGAGLGMTPLQLVQQVLVGSGVTVSNATFNGSAANISSNMLGSYNAAGTAATQLGFTDGIIIASGNAADAIGPNSSGSSGASMGTGSDPDLQLLIPSYTVYDKAVLEFDFVPISDTVKFRYVFGSEEFDEYCYSSFNDVFGFFISGPGITGPFSNNAKNIALMPNNPSNYVTIDNVCSAGSTWSWLNSGGQYFQYDRLTTVYTAWSIVQPCLQYHIKLAIGDAGDQIFDSGVFLEAHSFSTSGFAVTLTYSNPSLGNNAIEGCSGGIFAFTTSTPVTSPFTINYTVGGTATNGVDYTTIPGSVTIPAGQDSVAIVIDALSDALVEGTETVTLSITNVCTTQVYTMNIIDNVPLIATATGAVTICPGGSATLNVTGTGGITPYSSYAWDNGAGSGTTVTVNPAATTTYTVTVTDFCTQTATDDVVITVANNLSVTVTPANPFICQGENVTLTASGGATNYTWSPATGLSSTTGATVTASPAATTTYTVSGTDVYGCTASTAVTVNVSPISATAIPVDAHCGHSDGSATATPGGNCTQSWTYLWNTVPQQSNQTAINLPAGIYTVTVSCGACTTTASATVGNLPGPSVAITSITNTICGYANGGALILVSGGTPVYIYSWSNGQSGQNLTNVVAGTFNITVTDANGCTASNTVTITDTPGPTASISGINNASCGMSDGSAILNVNGGTPYYTFNWNSNPPQSSQNLQNIPTGNYTVTVTDANGCTTTTTVFVGEKPGPSATASSQNEICGQANGSATVVASGGLGIYTYLWSNGATTSTASGLTAGNYSVTVSDSGCTTFVSVNVLETPGPTADFSAHPKVLTLMDRPVSFLDNSSGNIINWQWDFGDGSIATDQNCIHQYGDTGTYIVTLIVTDNNGCTDTVSDTIKVKEIFTLYIPNTFTPNGDEFNDFFFPQGVNVDPNNFDMKIFDRWGNLMFHTTTWVSTHGEHWNGTKNNSGTTKDVVMDVYIYRILAKEIDGPEHEYIGHISLIP